MDKKTLTLLAAAVASGGAIGLVGFPSASGTAEPAPAAVSFNLCDGPVRTNCVVDGDTFWMNGEKIRVADIDTPEINPPRCASEGELGNRAKRRLLALLNEGAFELKSVDRDQDRYGRKLRVVVRKGQSLGDVLVNEGLARTWSGRREPWCPI